LRKFDYLAYDRKTLDQQTTYIETGLLATPGELPGGVSSSATATEEQLLTDSKLMQNPNLESGELYTVPPGSNKSAAEAHNGSSEAITSNTATTKPNDLKRTESIGGNQSSRTVGYYIKQIRENKSIPPVEVAEINNELYVINGHHRLEAAIRTGRKIEFKILTKEELGKYGYKSETEVINASSNVVPVKLNNKIIKGVSSDSN